MPDGSCETEGRKKVNQQICADMSDKANALVKQLKLTFKNKSVQISRPCRKGGANDIGNFDDSIMS